MKSAGKRKRRKNWNSEERKKHLLRRLQKAWDHRHHLLRSADGMEILRAIQTSVALSSIGIRVMWEYRNQQKHDLLGEYLETFCHYHIQDIAQACRQSEKYIAHCHKCHASNVDTEMPDAYIDLFVPTRSWVFSRQWRSEENAERENDADWSVFQSDTDTEVGLPRQQQACTKKTEPEPGEVEKKLDVDSCPQQPQVDSKLVKPQGAPRSPRNIFGNRVCKMDVDTREPIFEEDKAEDMGALRREVEAQDMASISPPLNALTLSPRQGSTEEGSKAETTHQQIPLTPAESVVHDKTAALAEAIKTMKEARPQDPSVVGYGFVGGFDVNTSAIGRVHTSEVVDDDASTQAGSVRSAKTDIRKGKTLQQADDDVSTEAGSVRTLKTFSGAGSSSASAQRSMTSRHESLTAMTDIVEGSEPDPDVANLEDVEFDENFALNNAEDKLSRLFDGSAGERLGAKLDTEFDSVATSQPWKRNDYKHLFGEVHEGDQLDPSRKRFKWTNRIIHEDDDTGHSLSQVYLIAFRQAAAATKLFGAFDMDCVPKDPRKVPTLADIQRAYGHRMPAYDNVLQRYLPSKVCVKDGKKCPYMVWYHLKTCAGMGAVFWDGSGGMKTFHKSTPLTPMLASWQIQDEKVGLWSEGEIAPMDVYEDPR